MVGKIIIFVAVMAISCWSLLSEPMPMMHDFLPGARIAEMWRGLEQGQWPVIWSENFAWGYGMPLFEFYAPLPYFLGAIFFAGGAGLSLIGATKALFILTNVASFWGMYFWARQLLGGIGCRGLEQKKLERGAELLPAICAALFTLASYRGMDIFARGALSEIMALAAIPWVFWGLTRLVRGRCGGKIILVVAMTVLVLSHNLTTLMMAGSLILYLLLLIIIEWPEWTQKRCQVKELWRIGWDLLLVAGLTLGLTAFYLLPAFFEQDYTQLDQWILADYYHYHDHFLYPSQLLRDNFAYGGSGVGENDGLSFFLGWGQWLFLLLAVVIVLLELRWLRFDKKKMPINMSFFGLILGLLIILGVNLYLSLSASEWVWNLGAGLMAYIQFPWRFLGIAVAFLALMPLALIGLRKVWLIIGLSIGGLIIVGLSSYNYFKAAQISLSEAAVASYIGTVMAIREESSNYLVDYLPREFNNVWQAVPEDKLWFNDDFGGQVQLLGVERVEMADKKYLVEASAAGVLELTIADYPEWRVRVNGSEQEKMVSTRGNLLVEIGLGVSIIEVKLIPTVLRRVVNWFSALTWLGCLGIGIFYGGGKIRKIWKKGGKKGQIKEKSEKKAKNQAK